MRVVAAVWVLFWMSAAVRAAVVMHGPEQGGAVFAGLMMASVPIVVTFALGWPFNHRSD